MTAYYSDVLFLAHDNGPGHPERPERLVAIAEALRAHGLWDRLDHRAGRAASDEEIALAHPASHIEMIRALSAKGGGMIDADTSVCARSFDAAAHAAGSVVDACDAVMRGDVSNAFCAVRPPGHHAETNRAMGFCLFNNVAIGARHLVRERGLERIAIVDWDVHHGNGTQEIFETDASVFYASTHQHPLYPGTGLASNAGAMNIPLPPGSDDDVYRSALGRIGERLETFRPEFLLISAGFDAHRRDPLASMLVTTEGFRWMMEWALARAGELCGGRMVAVLEGGYDLIGLSQSVAACVDAMLDA
jgi:acetoin utilization deacetylase AcuC-like enzyme